MTAEICLMNRFAAVLAADSASTVSHWDAQQQRFVERYFKGANKIFQLSAHHPIGLMINGTASLHGVPWEVIAKEFRKEFGDDACQTLDGYATEFFDFVRGHQHLFPNDHHEGRFRNTACVAALSVFWDADANDDRVRKAEDADAKMAAYRLAFEERKEDLGRLELNANHFRPEDVQAAIGAHSEGLIEILDSMVGIGKDYPTDIELAELVEFCIWSVFKNYKDAVTESTGIVLAGYADHDIFPSYCEYDCHGFLLNHFIVDEVSSHTVTHDVPAVMKAFAQSSMVDTFTLGLAADVYDSASTHMRKALTEFLEQIQNELELDAIPNAKNQIEEVREKHLSGWINDCAETHREPLFRVMARYR